MAMPEIGKTEKAAKKYTNQGRQAIQNLLAGHPSPWSEKWSP
ncbi:MAG: hypothetical protein ACJAUE_001613 [Alcanivorax sp.]|jgi:hypothetical protein